MRAVVFPLAAYVLARSLARSPVEKTLRYVLWFGTAVVIAGIVQTVFTATHYLGQRDFLCFWQYGHAGLAHQNIYAASTYRAMPLPIAIDRSFISESIDVGFKYPPPSILLFLPLALFHTITVASYAWLFAMIVALALGIAVLAAAYLRGSIDVLVSIAGLGFALPATAENVVYHQTNFLALAAMALVYVFRKHAGAGIAAAFAIVVKPYFAIVFLWFLLRRRFDALAASIGTLVIMTMLSLPFLGPGALHDYLFDNPAKHVPPSLFAESSTASLYALLIRTFHVEPSALGPLHTPIFMAIAIATGAVTLVVTARTREADDDLTLALAIAFALMLYPASGTMYAIALIPALVAFASRSTSERHALLFTGFAVIAYFANLNGNGPATFMLFDFTWALSLVFLYRERLNVSSHRW